MTDGSILRRYRELPGSTLRLPPMIKEEEEIVNAPLFFTARFEEMLTFVKEMNASEGENRKGLMTTNTYIVMRYEIEIPAEEILRLCAMRTPSAPQTTPSRLVATEEQFDPLGVGEGEAVGVGVGLKNRKEIRIIDQ